MSEPVTSATAEDGDESRTPRVDCRMALRVPLPVSIVVPARDEGATIDALIRSLLEQSRPAAEIIVVDAGSRDDTAERVRRWRDRASGVRLLEIGPAYPGQARNAGIMAAAHGWVALTDAGIQVEREWLGELWKAHEGRQEAGLVFGHYEPALRGWLTECATLAYVAPCARAGEGWWRGGSVASMLLDRRLWEKCGGFPPFRAAEDLIFMEAARAWGGPAAAAPTARVRWEIPSSWGATFRRFAHYSRHNLIAGRARYWHRGVARLYAAAAVMAWIGAKVSPVGWTLLAGAAVARTVRTVWARQSGSGVDQPWRPDRLLGVMALLLVLDAATAWGALEWLRKDALRGMSRRSRESRGAGPHDLSSEGEGAAPLCAGTRRS